MFCPQCGKPSTDNAKFCHHCGQALPEVVSQPPHHVIELPAEPPVLPTETPDSQTNAAPSSSSDNLHDADRARVHTPEIPSPEAAVRKIASETPKPAKKYPLHWYKAVIGEKNQSYYLEKFAQMDQYKNGMLPTWNWPACLITFYWLLARKMWGAALTYVGVSCGAALMTAILLGNEAMLAYFLLLYLIPGVYANAQYHLHCQAKIKAVLAQTRNMDEQIAILTEKNKAAEVAKIITSIIIGIFLVSITNVIIRFIP